ncbi:MAG TPA: F0F1 ATP synthase subunit gamma [Steroidobacteraceae bacterium]|nr:F0F1 ATP synthase subunit gamma [Steroidobacteraceae bacterium]
MTDSLARIGRKIGGARQLGSVVHAMKALATSSIGQYESAVRALRDYLGNVELGLAVCLRTRPLPPDFVDGEPARLIAIAFGSDQGLVGRFNEAVADHAQEFLARHSSVSSILVVGERLAERLVQLGRSPGTVAPVPSSVAAIAPLVARLLVQIEANRITGSRLAVHVFFNRADERSSFTPASVRLLPLDARWQRRLAQLPWPTKSLPEPIGPLEANLRAHLREYLFVSLFHACAESLSSENASRLAAMQRAERNIESLLEELTRAFNDLRQGAIDEELFDVIAGYRSIPAR